jgi:hypothetical protein
MNNIDFSKTDISIGKLIVNMCVDIRRILYMRGTDITIENYKIALHNKKTLEYVNYIYNNLKFAEISGIYIIISKYYDILSKDTGTIEDIKHIYNKIKTYIHNRLYTDIYDIREAETGTKKITEVDILMEFIKIYNNILILYARYFNNFIDPYVLIKEYDESSSAAVIALNPYCPIDAEDAITFDNIEDFKVMKRKYVINIIAYNKDTKKALYFCYDTVSLYNYILHSIAVSTEGKSNIEQADEILKDDGSRYIPKNPSTNLSFTDDELDEICNRIKFLTQIPTYNSHADIKEAIKQKHIRNTKRLLSIKDIDIDKKDIINIDKKKRLKNYKYEYDNSYISLAIDYLTYFIEITHTIDGEYKLYIAVNLGDISYSNTHLHIVNSLVNDKATSYLLDKNNSFLLKLPKFKEENLNKAVIDFLNKVKVGIEGGEYLSSNILPYREGDKPIIQLEPFAFTRNEDVDGLYKRFIDYASKNDHIFQGGSKRRQRQRRGRKRKPAII